MITCSTCRHSNFDGFATCSRCGSPLGGVPVAAGRGPSGVPLGGAGGGMDEYQRLMAQRAASARRNRMIVFAVMLVGLGGGGAWLFKERKKTAEAQAVLEMGGRFAEKDKSEMGAFWNCVTSSQVDVGMFQSADQIQQRIESAYFTQQKTFSEHLTTECVPKIERARGAMGAIGAELPSEMKEPFDKYLAALPKMQAGIESYAEKLKSRASVKDVDQTIQEVGGAYSPEPTPESIAFDKFMTCAIPDLAKKKDVQQVLELLAETCKADAVKFMTRVRETCGPLIQQIDQKAKPDKSFKVNVKKFYEEDQRQLQAWEYCGKRSRKGKKVLDLEAFLTAASDYMEARAEVVKSARDLAGRITGKPLEPEKKKAAAPAAEP